MDRVCEVKATTDAYCIDFPHLPVGTLRDEQLILNRYSSYITRDHDFPPARAMLYGAGIVDEESMQNKPQVGIGSTWWEGNPCNIAHNGLTPSNGSVLEYSATIKTSIEREGFLAWRYNTVGVSDAITMGHDGMRFSLQSRELIADSIETVTCAQVHDACIVIPGCDKNMPGCVMGITRHNRPSIIVYGGTQRAGYSRLLKRRIDMNTPSEARSAYINGTLKYWAKDGEYTADELMLDIERSAVPGPGACGGMYTANSLATVIETLGLSLPGSSSSPACSPSKIREIEKIGKCIRTCLEKDITPRKLLTRISFENAMTMMMALGGSTNSVLHTLAMARTANVPLDLDDFQRISSKTPFIADLAPSGSYLMEDLYNIGGVPSVMKLLIAAGLLDGTTPTITGKTLAQNVEYWPSLPQNQVIIRPLHNPIKSSGHIEVLRGNIAPGGAVAKITGKEGLRFTGKAKVFEKEIYLCDALDRGEISHNESLVLVVRYEGPIGGPGMPEQLRASGSLIGSGYKNIALITDGRYSGASHGFIIGHIVPEAAVGGPIAVVQDGDLITIDAEKHLIEMPHVSAAEIQRRLSLWSPPKSTVRKGTLAKYARLVSNASEGAVTDLF